MKRYIRQSKLTIVVLNMMLLLTATCIGIVLAEGILWSLGYNSYYENYQDKDTIVGRFPHLNAFCKIETIDEAIEQGLTKSSLGDAKYDEMLGFTYFSEPHGFNDDKNFYNDYSGFTRVLVLGDSFTRGASADNGKGFVDLLNQYYKKVGIIFFNTGVGGYGQNNQLAVLKKYFDIIEPRVVLLGFCTGNDFKDNATPKDRFTRFPYLHVSNYELIPSRSGITVRRLSSTEILSIYKRGIGCPPAAPPINSLKEFLREKIAYQTRLGTELWPRMRSIKAKLSSYVKDATLHESINKSKYLKIDRYGYEVTKNYLIEIKNFLHQRNTPFYILVIPDKLESTTRLKKSRNYQNAIILFKELDIRFIDPFEDLTLQDYVEDKAHYKDNHWNNSGHFKMFKKVAAHFGEKFEYHY